MADSGASLREALAREDTVVLPGVYDPLTAKIVRDLGFSAAYVGGFATAAHLGVTEPVVSATDQAEVVAGITRAVDLPLVVDAQGGWGDTILVEHAVRALEHAGAAGFHLEDKIVPTRAADFQNDGRDILPRDEFIEKFRRAVEARQNPNTVVIGRSDVLTSAGGTSINRKEEAIARAYALMEAGADVIFLHGILTVEDHEYFRAAMPDVPQMTRADNDTPVDTYRELGIKLLFYASSATLVVYHAIKEVYSSLRDTGLPSYSEQEFRDTWASSFWAENIQKSK